MEKKNFFPLSFQKEKYSNIGFNFDFPFFVKFKKKVFSCENFLPKEINE